MKQVRFMLTAIVIMAVIGGALAFKAKKSATVCLYTTTSSGTCINPVVETISNLQNNNAGPFVTTTATTTTEVGGDPTCTDPDQDCTVRKTFDIEP